MVNDSVVRYQTAEPANIAEFCPFDKAQDLLVYSTDSAIEVLRVTLPASGSADPASTLFTSVQQYPIGAKTTALDWSPETVSKRLPGGYETKIALAAAFDDRSIVFFASGSAPLDVCRSIAMRHQDAINDIAVDRIKGQLVASVSDDKTCRIWAIQDQMTDEADPFPLVMRLKSRGVSVNWNAKMSTQVLVGESSGAIRILDVETRQWLFSVFQPDKSGSETLLRSVDWNPQDPNTFGAVIGKRWYVWNVGGDQPGMHLPRFSHDAHPEMGHRFRWCLADPKVFATCTNAPEQAKTRKVAVKVFDNVFNPIPHSIVLSTKSRLTSISWHACDKVLAGVAGAQILFWSF